MITCYNEYLRVVHLIYNKFTSLLHKLCTINCHKSSHFTSLVHWPKGDIKGWNKLVLYALIILDLKKIFLGMREDLSMRCYNGLYVSLLFGFESIFYYVLWVFSSPPSQLYVRRHAEGPHISSCAFCPHLPPLCLWIK